MSKDIPLDEPLRQALGDVPKNRPCLRCKIVFESEGFGDRICRRCKATSAWRSNIAVSPGSARRR